MGFTITLPGCIPQTLWLNQGNSVLNLMARRIRMFKYASLKEMEKTDNKRFVVFLREK